MAPKSDQLKDKFDAFMGEDDDDSVGSARGSVGGKLGGLTGLRPASPGRGFGLGSLTSPGKPRGGIPSPASKPGPARGLGGLSKPTGGLGGLSKPIVTAPTKTAGTGLSKPTGLGGLSKPVPPKPGSSIEDAISNLNLSVDKVKSDLQSSVESNVEAMKSITSMVKGLAESTIASFREVSNRLNQAKDDPALQDSLDALIKNMDEEIASKVDQEAYIVIPGRDTSTVTPEEAAEILEGKSVRIFGSVGKLASVCS
jgi:hypothetical protein